MTRRGQWIRNAAVAGLMELLLSAPAQPAEKAKLTIGYSSTGPTAVGLWTAKEIGAFSKYGVEPNFVFISSSPVMVPALIGGDVQCAIAGANAVIAAALGGAADCRHRQPGQPALPAAVGTDGVSTRRRAARQNLRRVALRRHHRQFDAQSSSRRVGLENAVTIRQLGGTLEVGLAFRHRQIDAAVLATLRTDAPHRILLELADSGIQYSMGQLVVARRVPTARAGDAGKDLCGPISKASRRCAIRAKRARDQSHRLL